MKFYNNFIWIFLWKKLMYDFKILKGWGVVYSNFMWIKIFYIIDKDFIVFGKISFLVWVKKEGIFYLYFFYILLYIVVFIGVLLLVVLKLVILVLMVVVFGIFIDEFGETVIWGRKLFLFYKRKKIYKCNCYRIMFY